MDTRLSGTDWLDAQRVPYEVIPFSDSTPLAQAAEQLKCSPAQVMVPELFVNEKSAVIVIHPFSKKVNISLVEKHVGVFGLRVGTSDECKARTGLPLSELHPFLENYLWKVLDESIFDYEFVYIRAGRKNEIVKVEANALKYVIGVVNGLLAEVTQSS
jgi:prolyl-tRNA editing enzyme YbaK/EbsC (Cys-tRNA(Pro) deacylase)